MEAQRRILQLEARDRDARFPARDIVESRGVDRDIGALERDFGEFERATQQRGRGQFERGRERMD